MKIPAAICFILFCFCARALAQGAIPPIVSEGLKAYQESGSKAALAAWLKNSPVEKDANSWLSVSGLLGQVDNLYGKMIGAEPLRVVPVTRSIMRVYVILKFERGPLYAAFDCYKSSESADWVIPTIDFNVKPGAIIPAMLW